MRCKKCGHHLYGTSNGNKSLLRGYGPICYKKHLDARQLTLLLEQSMKPSEFKEIGKFRLKKVVITREQDDTWSLVRQREKNGETLRGLKSLKEAFDAVNMLYCDDGYPKVSIQDLIDMEF